MSPQLKAGILAKTENTHVVSPTVWDEAEGVQLFKWASELVDQ